LLKMSNAVESRAVIDVSDLATQEGWALDQTIVLCDSDVARDFGFQEDGPRWEARRLITGCIGAIRGYCGRSVWEAQLPNAQGVARMHRFVRFDHVIKEEGFTEVGRKIQVTQAPVPLPGLCRPAFVTSYGDVGCWAKMADAARGQN
jgi:hypothetical protein